MVAAAQEAGVRRFVHQGALGVEDDPALHYASSKAKAERARPRERPRLDDPQAVAPCSARATGSSTSSPGLVRLSPGVVPSPAGARRGSSRSHVGDLARVVVECIADPATVGRDVRARRPALLDVPRDHGRGAAAMGKRRAIVPMPVAADRARRRRRGGRPPAVPGRDRPAPPAAARQHRPARRRPRRASASSRSTMAGRLGHLRRRVADQEPEPLTVDSSRAARLRGLAGRLAVRFIWLRRRGAHRARRRRPRRPASSERPGSPGRAELTWAGDDAIEPALRAARSDLAALADRRRRPRAPRAPGPRGAGRPEYRRDGRHRSPMGRSSWPPSRPTSRRSGTGSAGCRASDRRTSSCSRPRSGTATRSSCARSS